MTEASPVTSPDLLRARLKELAERATPGPWTSERQDQDGGEIYFAIHSVHQYEFITNVNDGRARANAAYIAAANPQAILSLLSDLASLQAQVAVLSEALQPFANAGDPQYWLDAPLDLRYRGGKPPITVGHLCQANKALANLPQAAADLLRRVADAERDADSRLGDLNAKGREIEALEQALAAARQSAMTPGTVECCVVCGHIVGITSLCSHVTRAIRAASEKAREPT